MADYLTVADFASYAGVSTNCVRTWIRQGDLEAKAVGDRIYVIRRPIHDNPTRRAGAQSPPIGEVAAIS